MSYMLELKDVTKKYKDFTLDNISFNIEKGYVMGFIGPNGSGKTTTIKLIMNLIRKQSGSIKVFGKDNIKYEKEIKEKIGFVYDECNYFDNLTIKDNAKIIAPFYKKWDQKQFDIYLKRFDLNPSKKVGKLSKGMKTKFSLAVALSHHAEFIIMDEPTSGLDPVFRREILELLYDLLQDENKSIFFSTHITSDLDRIADYITFIYQGKLIFSKAIDDLNEEFKVVKGSNELLKKMDKSMLIGVKRNKYGFEALTSHYQKISKQYGDSIVLDRSTLEDIMVHYAGGNAYV